MAFSIICSNELNFTNMMRKIAAYLITLVISATISCSSPPEIITFQKQHFFYSNLEGNNTIEGNHICASSIRKDTLFFGEEASKIIQSISKSWIMGQGSGKPYYDTGKEKYWFISKILQKQNAIIIILNENKINPKLPFVFWKQGTFPVHFSDSLKGSWGFSKIIFDQTDSAFKTHLFECDTDQVNLYLASSKNLNHWNIKQLLNPLDFEDIPWNVAHANGKMMVTPLISDVVFSNNKYYSFAYGDDADEKTYIGLLASNKLEGPYQIIREPILSPNPESKFSNHDVYYPKVVKVDKNWLMFYTAKNDNNEEFICYASSKDLMNWKVQKENIIPRNQGWNKGIRNQITAQVKIKNDTIWLWATGIKEVGDFDNLNKGNVLDQCIGKFYSPKDSIHFKESYGNPVFGGAPNHLKENDHIGGSFQELYHDGYNYTFYHGKGRKGKDYTILIR